MQNSSVGGYNTRGFVEVLAASQSTVNKDWFQGTADAVRQYMWLFDESIREGVEDFLILSGKLGSGVGEVPCGKMGLTHLPGRGGSGRAGLSEPCTWRASFNNLTVMPGWLYVRRRPPVPHGLPGLCA